MAIGFIVKGKMLTGSCGGLGALGIDKECNCPEPCDARKKRETRAAKTEKWKKIKLFNVKKP